MAALRAALSRELVHHMCESLPSHAWPLVATHVSAYSWLYKVLGTWKADFEGVLALAHITEGMGR